MSPRHRAVADLNPFPLLHLFQFHFLALFAFTNDPILNHVKMQCTRAYGVLEDGSNQVSLVLTARSQRSLSSLCMRLCFSLHAIYYMNAAENLEF